MPRNPESAKNVRHTVIFKPDEFTKVLRLSNAAHLKVGTYLRTMVLKLYDESVELHSNEDEK